MNTSTRMNGLYTGLLAVVLGAGGCGREPRNPSQQYGSTAVTAAVNAPNETTAANLPGETTESTSQGATSLSPLLRGLLAGKYGAFYQTIDSLEVVLEGKAPMYKSLSLIEQGVYRVEYTESCSGKDAMPTGKSDDTCILGRAVWYDVDEKTFQVDVWRSLQVGTPDAPKVTVESTSYIGKGATLDWQNVETVTVNKKNTDYSDVSMQAKSVNPTVAEKLQRQYERVLATILPAMEQRDSQRQDRLFFSEGFDLKVE